MELVGRVAEIDTLNKMLKSNSSELIAVYGRRRVGKTFLIREVYGSNIVFEVTGYYRGTTRDQLKNFHNQLKKASVRFNKTKIPEDWITAFHMLENYLSKLRSKKKKVVFIDELPWISTSRSMFLTAFEHFWNTYCTRRDDLVVVVCGSAASFMVRKIVKNRGGLHNRLSCKMQLLPFNLSETEKFLRSKNIHYNRYDILKLYMALGGVPQYLNKIDRSKSVPQNIDKLCFEDNGELVNEFNEVFTSLFSNSKSHEKIVRVLSKTKIGVNRNKLLELCKFESGGVFTKTMQELIESGFVSQYIPWGKRNKDSLFRLSDEYSLFYLKFIESNKGQGKGTWTKFFTKQSFKSWSGFVYETICLKHVQQIKKELGVANIYTIHSSWANENAQIDLLIDRDDGIINLCEIKFYDGQVTINKPLYDNIRNKLFQFRESSKTRKNVFVTFISTFGVTENSNSLEIITNSLTSDCLFE